jgi:hypothetical protein
MRNFITFVVALYCSFALAPMCIGQQTSAYNLDGWNGLTLDKSTPEDAIRILGQPLSDKLNELRFRVIDKWITPRQKLKIFRVLAYKDAGEVKRAELAFLENRLVRIHIVYGIKQFPAADLKRKFGADFVPIKDKLRSDSTASMYEGRKEGPAPKSYPLFYSVVSVTPRSLIFVRVGRAGVKEAYLGLVTKTTDPGYVMILELISRTLVKT